METRFYLGFGEEGKFTYKGTRGVSCRNPDFSAHLIDIFILALLSKGFNVGEASEVLFLTSGTVSNRIARLCSINGSVDTMKVMTTAVELGLTNPIALQGLVSQLKIKKREFTILLDNVTNAFKLRNSLPFGAFPPTVNPKFITDNNPTSAKYAPALTRYKNILNIIHGNTPRPFGVYTRLK
ncbi:MAG: hypothetical protein WC744_04495 [Patescibacteria group bacterium]